MKLAFNALPNAQTLSHAPQTWQCVLICWGTKYNASHINKVFDQVLQTSRSKPHLVLLTDRLRTDVPSTVVQRLIDPFYLQPQFMQAGAQAKIAQFQRGALPFDCPAVFLDLDTLVIADLSRILRENYAPEKFLMLGNNRFSFSRGARCIAALTNGRLRTRGNGSIYVYDPASCHDLDVIFRAETARRYAVPSKAMQADDRFISWVYHARLLPISNKTAVKFPREFMARFRAWLYLKSALPGTGKRRAALAAIAFPGQAADLDVLLTLKDGAELKDEKGRRLIWKNNLVAPVKQALSKRGPQTP